MSSWRGYYEIRGYGPAGACRLVVRGVIRVSTWWSSEWRQIGGQSTGQGATMLGGRARQHCCQGRPAVATDSVAHIILLSIWSSQRISSHMQLFHLHCCTLWQSLLCMYTQINKEIKAHKCNIRDNTLLKCLCSALSPPPFIWKMYKPDIYKKQDSSALKYVTKEKLHCLQCVADTRVAGSPPRSTSHMGAHCCSCIP